MIFSTKVETTNIYVNYFIYFLIYSTLICNAFIGLLLVYTFLKCVYYAKIKPQLDTYKLQKKQEDKLKLTRKKAALGRNQMEVNRFMTTFKKEENTDSDDDDDD